MIFFYGKHDSVLLSFSAAMLVDVAQALWVRVNPNAKH